MKAPPIASERLRERSLQIILATQAPTGAFIAGPSFSQYGYAWFRDGAFIAHSLDRYGLSDASAKFHSWVAGVVLARGKELARAAASAAQGRVPDGGDYLHCRYSADGTPATEDWPSFQLDGPGIWLWSLETHVARGGPLSDDLLTAARAVADYLAALWRLPAYDAWEEFPDRVHTSTLGAISAGLRALLRIDPRPASHIAATADAVSEELGGRAAKRGYYPKWAGSTRVDGSLLWLAAPYELVAIDDPRYAATLARIERQLVAPGGGVYRYRTDSYYGGGAWILLAAALGSVYVRRGHPGDRERAGAIRGWIEAQADPDGLLPEQVATDALRPRYIDRWRQRWGDSARPLIWSHAAYLELLADLDGAAK